MEVHIEAADDSVDADIAGDDGVDADTGADCAVDAAAYGGNSVAAGPPLLEVSTTDGLAERTTDLVR